VVVLGDRPETLARVQSLGFRLIEARPLSSLGLSVLKLGTPGGLDSRQAVALLHMRLPGVMADVNSVYGSYETEATQVVSLHRAGLYAANDPLVGRGRLRLGPAHLTRCPAAVSSSIRWPYTLVNCRLAT
jgi:hypothetical protein